MQRTRRLFTAALAAATASAALVAGCSSAEKKGDNPLPDAATLVQQSAQTTRDLKSVHLELTVAGEIPELPIESLNGDLTSIPAVAAQGTANILFLGSKFEDVAFVVVGGNLYASLVSGGKLELIGPAADIYDVSAILNPDTGLANVLANFSDPKTEGREKVKDTDGVKITGQVSPDAVNKIAPQLKATGPVPGTVWIREDGNHELVQAKLEASPGNSVQMTLSEWGKNVTVTLPA